MGEVSRSFTLSQGDEKKYRIVCKESSRETLHSIVSSFSESGIENSGGDNCVDWLAKANRRL